MSILPSPAALAEVFRHKYGPPEACGDGPRQRWRHGYFLVMGLMAVIAAGMLVWFRRKRWL